MSLDIICQGWLAKEGGKGHTYKNRKVRWFVLKDLFLFYFTEKPADGAKNMTNLKGMIYTPACRVKDNPTPKKGPSFIVESKDKEYIFSVADSGQADADNYLLSWRNSLEYVIERSAGFKEAEVLEGWLQKRGGKGHNYKNWKKRHFLLRGNLLSYFGDVRSKEDDVSQLKGFIEMSQIVELDTTSDHGVGYDFNWRLLLGNGKEYIVAAKDEAEKEKWIGAIRKRIKKLAKLAHPIALDYKETVVSMARLSRTVRGKTPVSNFFVLSNLNLRYYKNDISKEAVEDDWGKGLLGTMPLVGCAVLPEKDVPDSATVIDVTGNRFLLTADSAAQMADWTENINSLAKDLVKQIISRGDTIRLNCLARSESQNNGYTALCIDKNNIQLNFFMLKRKVDISFKQLKRVYMSDEEIFCLRYETSDEIRVLNIICANAKGVHAAIHAAFEEVKGERSEKKASAQKLEKRERKKKKKTDSSSPAKKPKPKKRSEAEPPAEAGSDADADV
eukprot:TRINITY_DN483_c0_g1_i1.p1 TRINITY_DN483_c0_g1~~TRINITY_DN483_c0_g1_i1.p1  ORF type:complete len:512 (-),score=103.03 TRINITY_DN483_c0_g1_i1:44-1549(-)